MKKLYLASAIDRTAQSIAKDIGGKKLKLAFINTASEVETGNKQWSRDDRAGLVKADFDLFDYTLTDKTRVDLERDLHTVDVIHVDGGTTVYLLVQARKCGFDKWIKEALAKDKIYTGSSTGSLAATPDIELLKSKETEKYEQELGDYKAFGLVDFIALSHWGNKDFKDKFLKKRLPFALKRELTEYKIILLNDWQYVKVANDMYRIVDTRD